MTHRIWVGRPATAGAAALFLAISVAFSACYTGDQSCAPAYDVNDVNDHCPYGSPGGPKAPAADNPCPEITRLSKGPDCQVGGKDVNFTDHVFPLLNEQNKGNCMADFCHGKSPKSGGLAKFKTAQETLDALSVYKGVIGAADKERTYFNLDSTKSRKSWVVCNLRGQAGSLMPKPPTPRMTATDVAIVEKWLACGATPGGGAAPPPPEDGTDGAAGDGGAGGEGASAGDGGSGQGGAP